MRAVATNGLRTRRARPMPARCRAIERRGSSQSLVRALVCSTGLLLVACGAAPVEPINGLRESISGGSPVLPGAWPAVAWLDNGCTGVLLAPDLVVFAAHCGTPAAAWFADVLQIVVDEAAGTAKPVPTPRRLSSPARQVRVSARLWRAPQRSAAKTKPKREIGGRGLSLRYRG
jgi:hypothetical protein